MGLCGYTAFAWLPDNECITASNITYVKPALFNDKQHSVCRENTRKLITTPAGSSVLTRICGSGFAKIIITGTRMPVFPRIILANCSKPSLVQRRHFSG